MKMFSKSDELDKVIKAINDLNEKIDEKDIEIYEHKCQIELLEDEKEKLKQMIEGHKIQKERLEKLQ